MPTCSPRTMQCTQLPVLLINTNHRWSDALLVSLYLIKGNLNDKRNDGLAENGINEKVDASPVTQEIVFLSLRLPLGTGEFLFRANGLVS